MPDMDTTEQITTEYSNCFSKPYKMMCKNCNKLSDAMRLMQRICDTNVTMSDLDNLSVDIEEKRQILSLIDDAKCTEELNRIKELIAIVEKGNTVVQGGQEEW